MPIGARQADVRRSDESGRESCDWRLLPGAGAGFPRGTPAAGRFARFVGVGCGSARFRRKVRARGGLE